MNGPPVIKAEVSGDHLGKKNSRTAVIGWKIGVESGY